YQLGIELADQVIADYILNEQRYPETIGIILWATSNSRSHGQCLGEFLYLLGVRPKWQSGGRVSGLEVIPLEELQRPRIDVMGRISGLIRDMMPTAIGWLDKAVEMVAELDESLEDNYVKKHIHDDVDWLVEQGEDPLLATKKARLRIFGDPPQAYGTGVG
ncbi:MAG: CobN/magnesium chelatase, partial [Veillonella dispar DORA_11]